MHAPIDAVQAVLQVLRDPLFGIALSLLLFKLSKSSQQQRAPSALKKILLVFKIQTANIQIGQLRLPY